MNDVLMAIIAALGGGGWLVSLISFPYARKKAKAEAEQARADAETTFANGWKEIAAEQKQQRIELEQKYEEKFAKQDKRILAVSARNSELRQLVALSLRCDLLMRNPEAICPVQKELKDGSSITDCSEETDV